MRTKTNKEDIIAREKEVKSWRKRFDKLKQNGFKKAQFCRKYGFDKSWLSRALNMKPLPSWTNIKKVNNFLDDAEKKYI